MRETKRKGAPSSRPKTKLKAAASKQLHRPTEEGLGPAAAAVQLMAAEPAANLRAVMNAHGAGLLAALGEQMNAYLNSLAVSEGASRALTVQCGNLVAEIGKLLEAVEQYQGAHAEALVQAALLRRLVAEFAQHVSNSQALGLTN